MATTPASDRPTIPIRNRVPSTWLPTLDAPGCSTGARRIRSGRGRRQHAANLILILARDLTSRLATPAFVVDAAGTLAYFNEAAEPVLGRATPRPESCGRANGPPNGIPPTSTGTPLPLEDLPLGIAFREGRPAPAPVPDHGGDGVTRDIEVTAFPLSARPDEIVGAIAVFWDRPADG